MCFLCKMTFDNQINRDKYYKNYIFKNVKIKQVLIFNICNIIAKIRIIYKHTIEYNNLLLFSKHNRLIIQISVRYSIILVK